MRPLEVAKACNRDAAQAWLRDIRILAVQQEAQALRWRAALLRPLADSFEADRDALVELADREKRPR
ncbi:hypothetical protein [Variovorax sp. dw_308]|uniref:hypothetical protein n=1 Tax=Variovorax sp. dw_308 TaxID=2721546 RepID=UPI001C48D397|nr:hypothetical protein [Variovorax sp. dw_308]